MGENIEDLLESDEKILWKGSSEINFYPFLYYTIRNSLIKLILGLILTTYFMIVALLYEPYDFIEIIFLVLLIPIFMPLFVFGCIPLLNIGYYLKELENPPIYIITDKKLIKIRDEKKVIIQLNNLQKFEMKMEKKMWTFHFFIPTKKECFMRFERTTDFLEVKKILTELIQLICEKQTTKKEYYIRKSYN